MGVAGDIGFGLGIILREWWLFYEVHGVGISRDHPGELIFDSIDIAPRANSDDYLEWLIGYLKFHKIDVFVPTSEAEIEQDTIAEGIAMVRLETVVLQKASIGHYEPLGYYHTQPIGSCLDDPLSLFMEKHLAPLAPARLLMPV